MAMETNPIKKVGRPKKFDEFVYFGMKISPEDKQKIKSLAKSMKKPASSTIMELVNQALNNTLLPEIKLKPTELLKLSVEERRRIIKEQMKNISPDYDYIEDNQDYIEYD